MGDLVYLQLKKRVAALLSIRVCELKFLGPPQTSALKHRKINLIMTVSRSPCTSSGLITPKVTNSYVMIMMVGRYL